MSVLLCSGASCTNVIWEPWALGLFSSLLGQDSSSGDGWLDLAGFFTDRNLVIVLSAAAVLLVLTIVLVICCCVWTCRGPESRIRGEETAFFVGGRSRSCCGLRWRGCCGAGERNVSSGRPSGSKKKEKKRKLVLTRTEADRGFPYDDEKLDYRSVGDAGVFRLLHSGRPLLI